MLYLIIKQPPFTQKLNFIRTSNVSNSRIFGNEKPTQEKINESNISQVFENTWAIKFSWAKPTKWILTTRCTRVPL
jgi:hypothetical protein